MFFCRRFTTWVGACAGGEPSAQLNPSTPAGSRSLWRSIHANQPDKHTSCLRWLLHFNILAHLLPPLNCSGTRLATMAHSAKVPLTRLKSVARMSMTGGFLCEPEPKHLAHSRISAQFAAQPALQDWAKFMTSYSAPTAERMAEATQNLGDTVRKDQTAYNNAFGTEMPVFEHVGREEETAALFARYMRSHGSVKGGR